MRHNNEMADFVWLDEQQLVNLDSVTHVEIDKAEARIIFSNGRTLTVTGEQRLSIFLDYLKKKFKAHAVPPPGKSGFLPGPRLS
jgi:hypothetical protein